ncbi:MAG TPA: ABC transporter ATP-binding protein [Solirubrobacteraceae bacterium]|nr:ABC transporter ATP-binding protein [Solirubrobacteraceae bacterium]
MSAVLSVSGLGKRYGPRRSNPARDALSDVSLELAAGELVALVGPNGAGKTTLLSLIAGIHRPSSGTVTYAASPPGATAWSTAATARRIGWVPQTPALYSRLTVAENLELFARLEGLRQPRAAVARMLEQTGLRERASEPAGRLSGGNRQRVNVALGLIADPPVLALDEPSAALDPLQRDRLWQFLAARVHTGTAVLFSTHNASEAQRHATRVLVLADGRLLFDGAPPALLAQGGEGPGGDLERALVRFLREHAQAEPGA